MGLAVLQRQQNNALTVDRHLSVMVVDSGNTVPFIKNKMSCYSGKLRLNYHAVNITKI